MNVIKMCSSKMDLQGCASAMAVISQSKEIQSLEVLLAPDCILRDGYQLWLGDF